MLVSSGSNVNCVQLFSALVNVVVARTVLALNAQMVDWLVSLWQSNGMKAMVCPVRTACGLALFEISASRCQLNATVVEPPPRGDLATSMPDLSCVLAVPRELTHPPQ